MKTHTIKLNNITPSSLDSGTVKLGSRVVVNGTSIKATVTGILLENCGLQYRICYWSENSRRIEWVFANEVKSSTEIA
jgi:hypothetical protein